MKNDNGNENVTIKRDKSGDDDNENRRHQMAAEGVENPQSNQINRKWYYYLLLSILINNDQSA